MVNIKHIVSEIMSKNKTSLIDILYDTETQKDYVDIFSSM